MQTAFPTVTSVAARGPLETAEAPVRSVFIWKANVCPH